MTFFYELLIMFGLNQLLPSLGKLALKLQNTKSALKQWNKNLFGRVDSIIKDLELCLNKLEEEKARG